jgi:hypothetical protein
MHVCIVSVSLLAHPLLLLHHHPHRCCIDAASFGLLRRFNRCIQIGIAASSRPFASSRAGLRNKREVYRVNYTLSKVRSVARTLLTLPEKVSPTPRRPRGFSQEGMRARQLDGIG